MRGQSDSDYFAMSVRRAALDYVCHGHQTLASRCGCLNTDDYCLRCNGKITAQFDGRYCMMCDFELDAAPHRMDGDQQ
jgi:hypothetical protein